MTYDVIVIGGSFAGLAAATQLARARRRVLVVDAGQRRNRFAKAAHGFLSQDGRPPAEIIADAREQLRSYPTVEMTGGTAVEAVRLNEEFVVTLGTGAVRQSRRLVLATGVIDTLPDIAGLAERWGQAVFHCPYCHGYELDMGRIGVVATGEMSLHQALLVAEWGRTTLLANDAFEADAGQRQQLAGRGVELVEERIEEISGHADVRLADGRVLSFDGLFTASQTKVASPLAEQLGCAFAEGPLGSYIQTEMFMKTSVPGVFACGDAARAAGSVSTAVGDGAMAGVGAHQSLVFS